MPRIGPSIGWSVLQEPTERAVKLDPLSVCRFPNLEPYFSRSDAIGPQDIQDLKHAGCIKYDLPEVFVIVCDGSEGDSNPFGIRRPASQRYPFESCRLGEVHWLGQRLD